MTYKSRKDTWLACICFGIPIVATIPFLFISFSMWDLIPPIVIIGFIGDLYWHTEYSINQQTIEVRSGYFFKKQYAIKNIRLISESNSIESAPALSLHRIRISFEDGKDILVSPKRKQQFIEELTSINHQITINKKS